MSRKIKPCIQCGKTGEEKTIAAGIGMREGRYENEYFVAVVFFFVYLTLGFKIKKGDEK